MNEVGTYAPLYENNIAILIKHTTIDHTTLRTISDLLTCAFKMQQ